MNDEPFDGDYGAAVVVDDPDARAMYDEKVHTDGNQCTLSSKLCCSGVDVEECRD